jgi:hypothetical protein
MSVRRGLLGTVMSPTSPSVEPGPFGDILQVRDEITLRTRMFILLTETTLTVVTGCYM